MERKIENIINDIERQGWSIQEGFFSTILIKKLKKQLTSLSQQGRLKKAGMGREKIFHIEQSIRNDEISWFDDNKLNSEQKGYLKHIQQLQHALNQKLFLGLFEFEVHFALYAKNTFYKRHLDQHINQDSRVLSVITYLNESWHKEDGGELQLYLENGETISILPKAGTLVCFMSAEFEHEVLPAKRERASLTGWFRKRAKS